MAIGPELSSHAHLWDGSDPDWVILAVSNQDDDGMPYNRRTGMTMLICDDEELAGVLDAMRSHGVPTVREIPSSER